MQKKPLKPNPPAPPQKVVKKMPPGGRPATPPPPRPMVTAEAREQRKQERRAQVRPAGFTPPPPATRPGQPPVPPPQGYRLATTAGRASQPAAGAAGAAASEALQAELDRFNTLQPRLMLTSINDELEDIESAIAALPANVENIRARGYVFKTYLEKKIETLGSQWRDLRPRVESAVQTQGEALRREAVPVQNTLNRRQPATAALGALESRVDAAVRNLEGMYDTLDDNVNQTQQQIDDISWTLQQAEQASFGFTPAEAPVEAVPANWKKPGDKDGVDGVLFLTDQRLIFEQKEEVATKKVLFITTAKEKVQALAWAVPVGKVAKAVGSKRGFMSKDDFLTVALDEGASFEDAEGQPVRDDDSMRRALSSTDLHLKGESGEAWQGFIGRVKSGEIDKDRTTPVDQEAVEAVKNAPTKCSNCGATITQTIVRGQTEVTCDFCGSVMRL